MILSHKNAMVNKKKKSTFPFCLHVANEQHHHFLRNLSYREISFKLIYWQTLKEHEIDGRSWKCALVKSRGKLVKTYPGNKSTRGSAKSP